MLIGIRGHVSVTIIIDKMPARRSLAADGYSSGSNAKMQTYAAPGNAHTLKMLENTMRLECFLSFVPCRMPKLHP
jgi:hypothetical protein